MESSRAVYHSLGRREDVKMDIPKTASGSRRERSCTAAPHVCPVGLGVRGPAEGWVGQGRVFPRPAAARGGSVCPCRSAGAPGAERQRGARTVRPPAARGRGRAGPGPGSDGGSEAEERYGRDRAGAGTERGDGRGRGLGGAPGMGR